MKTFSIITLGCKVNQYESQQIRELLEHLGLIHSENSRKPDLIIVNTCCVTHTASAKSRQYIRKAQRLNPDAAIVVSGCLPIAQIGELNNSDKNAYVIRNRETAAYTLKQIVNGDSTGLNSISPQLPQNSTESENSYNFSYENNLSTRQSKDLVTAPKPLNLPLLTCFKGHTRAFLKVQDGCDGYCTYCIVPKTRPVVQSKPQQEVLQEAKTLVESGHKEIVVTGVFLGAYGQKTVRRTNWNEQRNNKLADLLDKMAEINNLARIRISSLEPADITPRLLDTFCKRRNIMPHLHLSLQSGSDQILKKMRRQYTVDKFREKVELIKTRLDKPAITTDIIVGFPGETDVDFQQTVDLAKEVGFAKMHIFTFSPRKGTPAANMQDTIDKKVIKKRAKILQNLNIELGMAFRQQFIGETSIILLENTDSRPCGRSERYFMVYLKKSDFGEPASTSSEGFGRADIKPKRNELLTVKLVANNESGMVGESLRQQD